MTPSNGKTSSSRARRQKQQEVSWNKENCASERNSAGDDTLNLEEDKNVYFVLLDEFLRAVSNTKEADFWKRDVAECVVEAAISMPRPPSNSLLLTEKSTQILNSCRRLIKRATSEPKGKISVDEICVAVLGLRALVCVLEGQPTRDASIKLFYHAICFLGKVSASDKKITENVNRAVTCCVAACEGLANVLHEYAVPAVSFGLTREDERNSKGLSECFPAPCERKRGECSGSISVEQLLAIGVSAILDTSRALLMNEWTKEGGNGAWHGLLRRCLGVGFREELSRSFVLQIVRGFLLNVGGKWVLDVADRSSVKEAVSYCKKFFKLLWEEATRQSIDDDTCLAIRLQALLALLCDVPSSKQKTRRTKALEKVRLAVFDYACGSASFAAATYARVRDYSAQNLRDFHESVGTILDSTATCLSIPYVDYCVQRAVQCGMQSNDKLPSTCPSEYCCFRSLPWAVPKHNCCDDVDADERLYLGVVYIALGCKAVFDSDDVGMDTAHTMYETIIDSFNTVLLRPKKEEPHVKRLASWYRGLTSLSLHLSLYKAVDALDEASSIPVHLLECILLTSKLLTKVHGPICSQLLRHDAFPPDKKLANWDLLTEFYIRPSIAHDMLAERYPDSALLYRQKANDMVFELTSVLTLNDSRPSQRCLEKSAKSLWRLGRIRWETGAPEAIDPLLCSLLLFMKQPELHFVEGSQLSVRWASIASIYATLDRHEESIISNTMAIAYDILEKSKAFDITEDEKCLGLLKAVASFSKGHLSLGYQKTPVVSGNRRKYILRLVESNGNDGEDGDTLRSAKYAITPQHIVKSLMDLTSPKTSLSAKFEQNSGAPFRLASILHATLNTQLKSLFPEVDDLLFEVEVAVTIVAIMFEAGNSLTSDEENVSYGTFCQLCSLALSVATNVRSTNDNIHGFLDVARSLVYSCASFALCPDNISVDDQQRLQRSFHFLKKASSISEGAEGSEWETLSRVVSLSLRHSLARHPASTCELREDNIRIAEKLLELLDGAVVSSAVTAAAFRCALQSLSSMANELSGNGDFNGAALLSLWSLQIAENATVFDENTRLWARDSIYFYACYSKVKDVVAVSVRDDAETPLLLYDEEYFKYHLCLRAGRTNEIKDILELEKELHAGVEKIDERVAHSNDCTEKILLLWAKGTLLMGLVFCSNKIGRIECSVGRVKACFGCSNEMAEAILCIGTDKDQRSAGAESSLLMSSLFHLGRLRALDCLRRLAAAYEQLGDHRKCLGYAKSLLSGDHVDFNKDGIEGNGKFDDILAAFRSKPHKTLLDYDLRRTFLALKAKTIPLDIVCGFVGNNSTLVPSAIDPLFPNLEILLDNLAVCEISAPFLGFQSRNHVRDLFRRSRSNLTAFLASESFVALKQVVQSHQLLRDVEDLSPVFHKLELSELEVLIKNMTDDHVVPDEDIKFLRREAISTVADNFDRARALYLLGLVFLKRARFEGELEGVWESPVDAPSKGLQEATSNFLSSLALQGSSCDSLTRDAMRCLFLAQGNYGNVSNEQCLRLNSSIGRSFRQSAVRALQDSDASRILGSLDNFDETSARSELLSDLREYMPNNSRVLSFAICPTGELLATAIEISECDRELKFISEYISPLRSYSSEPEESAYNQIIEPFDKIIVQNQEQLNGNQDDDTDNDEWKRSWWKSRNKLDSELGTLLQDVDRSYFGSNEMRRLLFGKEQSDEDPGANLASRFDEVYGESLQVTSRRSEPSKMRVVELRRELEIHGMEPRETQKMKKAQLVEAVIRKRRTGDKSDQETKRDSLVCIFLILDENLSRFPFESLPSFEGKSICRIPSLPFAVLKFRESFSSYQRVYPFVKPSRVSFVLDPESNLRGTATRIQPVLERLSNTFGSSSWEGFVGEAPPPEFMERKLAEESSLMLYFGHGGGQQYVTWKTIEKLLGDEEVKQRCTKASAFLMGCSSGRLQSVNQKGTNTTGKLPIHYEPEGIALSYLLTGSPSVVGNLWDVTDRDIDRFAVEFLEQFFSSKSEESIAECVSNARSACKLRYLVGGAPVCYGIPVFNELEQSYD